MLIMGHRGAKGELPENTLLGFEKAISLGLKAIELDIHSTSDGELAVIHDDTVDRTTNGSGSVNDLSLAELQKLDAGQNQKVPTLMEAFDLLLPANLEIQIEVKDGKTLSALTKLIEQTKQKELLTVISFHHGWLKDFKERMPKIKTACLLYGRPLNAPDIAKSCHANGISFNIGFIDSGLREQTKKAGLSLTGWNANTLEDFQEMKALELDYLGTDVPSEAIRWSNR